VPNQWRPIPKEILAKDQYARHYAWRDREQLEKIARLRQEIERLRRRLTGARRLAKKRIARIKELEAN
jgi:hypothetical protein